MRLVFVGSLLVSPSNRLCCWWSTFRIRRGLTHGFWEDGRFQNLPKFAAYYDLSIWGPVSGRIPETFQRLPNVAGKGLSVLIPEWSTFEALRRVQNSIPQNQIYQGTCPAADYSSGQSAAAWQLLRSAVCNACARAPTVLSPSRHPLGSRTAVAGQHRSGGQQLKRARGGSSSSWWREPVAYTWTRKQVASAVGWRRSSESSVGRWGATAHRRGATCDILQWLRPAVLRANFLVAGTFSRIRPPGSYLSSICESRLSWNRSGRVMSGQEYEIVTGTLSSACGVVGRD